MKASKYFKFLKNLAKTLGDEDLTVSMAYSNSQFFVSISTHESKKFQYDHGGYQRTVQITDKDLDLNSPKLLEELVNIYSRLLKPKEKDADVTERD